MNESDRFRGCLLGLAVGDAVGTTAEFKPRGSFSPITDMVGGGPFDLKPGEWTDDTAMALCLATSLLAKNGFDATDQMNRYVNWMEYGYLSSNGCCFDIGLTVRNALWRYQASGEPISGSTDPGSAGNGSIMRLAPIPMFYAPEHDLVLRYSAESSRTTHGAAECLDACRVLGDLIFRALSGHGKNEILSGSDPELATSDRIRAICRGEYRDKAEDEIRGTGYVVASLEAALWCFHVTDGFEAAVLRAANLGDDADTTAAVCGQLAGAHYGEQAIPQAWLARLVMRDQIGRLADDLRLARA